MDQKDIDELAAFMISVIEQQEEEPFVGIDSMASTRIDGRVDFLALAEAVLKKVGKDGPHG